MTTFVLYRHARGRVYFEEVREELAADSLKDALPLLLEGESVSRNPLRDGELVMVGLRHEGKTRMPLHLFRARVSSPSLERLGCEGAPIDAHGAPAASSKEQT